MTLIARPQRLQLRTSVLVPCVAKHTGLIPELLAHLAAQSTKPDEVVIAVSGCRTPDDVRNYAVLQPFPVRIDDRHVTANASVNRNRASDLATGDVFIYQDADDLPHPQRVEILKQLFEEYDVDHVMHAFTHGGWMQGNYHIPSILHTARYETAYRFHSGITNGNPATSRAVHGSVWWDHGRNVGEDVFFNQSVYARFPGRKAVLDLPLLLYRQHLSGTRYT